MPQGSCPRCPDKRAGLDDPHALRHSTACDQNDTAAEWWCVLSYHSHAFLALVLAVHASSSDCPGAWDPLKHPIPGSKLERFPLPGADYA